MCGRDLSVRRRTARGVRLVGERKAHVGQEMIGQIREAGGEKAARRVSVYRTAGQNEKAGEQPRRKGNARAGLFRFSVQLVDRINPCERLLSFSKLSHAIFFEVAKIRLFSPKTAADPTQTARFRAVSFFHSESRRRTRRTARTFFREKHFILPRKFGSKNRVSAA